MLIAIPCVWQPHIQANDLSSHLYNAWLANQVSAGELKGLYLAPQFTNVLFDHLLSLLLRTGSLVWTERIAVLLAVQVFFWGCFACASALGGRPAWTLAPFLALLAYGSVFRMGFFNFYISAGICLWAVALIWRNRPGVRLLAIPLLLMAWTAHSLPCAWAAAVIGYVFVARRLKPGQRWWLAGGGLIALPGLALWLAGSFPSRWTGGLRVDSMFGADQVLIYGFKYKFLATALLCFWILLLLQRFAKPPSPAGETVFQLWVLNAAACLVLPDAVWLPFYAGGLSFLTMRLSLLSGILFCGVIASVPVKTPHKLLAVALSILFFGCSYWDERTLNSVEQRVARAVTTLPPGAHAVSTLQDSRLNPWALEHVLDRACIGRCFDFVNYEPSTTQFRLRAQPGNAYVISDYQDLVDLERGQLIFQRTDIDLYRLSPCRPTGEICVSRVKPGDRLAKDQVAPGSEPLEK
ncbi:MAG: hypothetical protein LAP38_07865 [Acidobacteriia bacterium]|nr:hypothetical protein [Terriglobia bacterium]